MRLEDVPDARLHFYPHIGAAFTDHLQLAEQSIVGAQYCFDHDAGCNVLHYKRQLGVQVRILLDAGQVERPSCFHQSEKLRALMGEGVQFKALDIKERRGRFSIMHAKTFLIDGEIYIGGSANFTNNACHSEEQLIVLKNAGLAEEYLNWFEGVWNCPEAKEVDYTMLGQRTGGS